MTEKEFKIDEYMSFKLDKVHENGRPYITLPHKYYGRKCYVVVKDKD